MKNLTKVAVLFVFMMIVSVGESFAQEYCFWVVNHRNQDLYALKVKETNKNYFSQDLLPNTVVKTGQAYWIRVTNWSSDLGDLQVTDLNQSPLVFNVTTVSGNYADFNYIRLNFRDIHTLVLNADNTFSVYNHDQLGLGHPCSN